MAFVDVRELCVRQFSHAMDMDRLAFKSGSML